MSTVKIGLVPFQSVFNLIAMSSSTSAEAILLLTTRLQKAEKRLKLLTCEIGDIKKELTLIQQNPNSCSARNYATSTRESSEDNESESKSKRPRYDFAEENGYTVVYTDGACENNGKIGAKAGIGIWFGQNHPLNVSEPVKGRATNNTAEIQACVQAVTIAHRHGIKKLLIKTDSQFVINSITNWIHRWKLNNWKVHSGGDVKNKDDFIKLDNGCQLINDVKWVHVDGHKGIIGNEEADKLARAGAARYK